MTRPALPKRRIATRFGDIAYLERGSDGDPPVLFVHGIPTSGYLWRRVIDELGDELRCYAPDLMGLGDTHVSPTADVFHMAAQADMLVDFMNRLGHERFGLVCHDQGGAAAQIIAARFPQRVAAWVITNSVCYDNWPVPAVKRYQTMSRHAPLVAEVLGRAGVIDWVETSTRWSAFRRGVYNRDALTAATIREYLRPMRESRDGRERFRAFLLAGDSSYTESVVPELRTFSAPTTVLWAGDDAYLSPSWGRKLADDIPGCSAFDIVPFCGHFWQEEKPREFAAAMRGLFRTHLGAGAARAVHLPVVSGPH